MKCDRCNRPATHVCDKAPKVWLCSEHALSHESYCKGSVRDINEEPKEKAVTK